ncbi:MAG: hypothetical protein IBJ18_14020 [Phycisphaerales bacterium]|nr:hypothetical protein [Phycisphaerales bacterium]
MQQAYAMVLSAGRCAVWAARYRKRAYYEASLVALIMSDGVVDFRDLLRSLAVVYRCGQIIGYSPHEELNVIADASNSVNTKSVIKNGFLARDETLRSLTAFGINQVGGEDGLWFSASHSI